LEHLDRDDADGKKRAVVRSLDRHADPAIHASCVASACSTAPSAHDRISS
jgi:hypothetical protein